MSRRKGERVNRRYSRIIDDGNGDKSWMRWTKCFVCRRRFCVNNYEDRKVRVSQLKVKGKVLCPGCRRSPHGPRFVQLYLIAVATWREGCVSVLVGLDVDPLACKCVGCVAGRVVARMDEERGISRVG
jgi:hypothetical protein